MGWEQLGTINQEARQTRAAEANQPPDACPFDGEPLDVLRNGNRNCRLGNYTWRGGPPPDPPK